MNTSHFVLTRKAAIYCGLSGILGGMVLFAGDMLFYYNGEQTNFTVNMGVASSERIIASALCALFAAWLYTFGSGLIYYAFQPAKKWIRLSLFYSFAAIMITYGVVHGAYVAIAVSAKNAVDFGIPVDAMVKLAVEANDGLRMIAYAPFGLFTLLFVITVWKKESHFPRWILFFTPAVPFLFAEPIAASLSGSLKTIIAGGYLNLILVVFFSATTIALWKNERPS